MSEPTILALFDPVTTLPPYCPHCDTGDCRMCRYDNDVREGYIPASSRRPKQCLNTYDPATSPFPDGF